MKNIFGITFIALTTTIFAYSQPTLESTIYLYTLQAQVNNSTERFNLSVSSDNRTTALQWIDSLKSYTTKQMKEIKSVEVYLKETNLKNTASSYITHLNNISKKIMPEYFSYYFNSFYSPNQLKKTENLRKSIYTDTQALYQKFVEEVRSYKSKYNIIQLTDFSSFYVEVNKFDSALYYNDYIVDMVDRADYLWTRSIEEEWMPLALAWTDSLKMVSEKMIRSLNNLQPFFPNEPFRLSALDYLKHFSRIASNELPEFIKIIRADEMNADQEARANELIPILDNIREALFDSVEVKQYQFADVTGIEIQGRSYFVPNKSGIDYQYTVLAQIDDPVVFNAYLSNMVSITDSLWVITIEEENLERAHILNQELQSKTGSMLNHISQIVYPGDGDDFKKAVIDYITHLNKITYKELARFIDLIRSKDFNSKMEREAESLIPILDDERERLMAELGKKQVLFFKANHIDPN